MSKKLKPCPFCGDEIAFIPAQNVQTGQCSGCRFVFELGTESIGKFVEKFNTRIGDKKPTT